MPKVAVYGTLKQGGRLHNPAKMQFVGSEWIEGYEMYEIGWFPGVIKGEGEIRVELFEVDDFYLEIMDQMEGHPFFFKRETIEVNGENVYIYIYQRSTEGRERVISGDFDVDF